MPRLFDIAEDARPDMPEYMETLLTGAGGLVLERIISRGHTTAPGEWYEQKLDEWVAVLRGNARIGYADGTEVALAEGDSLILPNGLRHRVSYSSSPCIWLALHAGDLRGVL